MLSVTGNIYTTNLPEGYVKVDSLVDLFEMKGRRKKYVKENLQFQNITVILFSEASWRFYQRDLRLCLESYIRTFIRQMILYMPEGLKCLESERNRRETLLMIEWTESQRDLQGRETKLKLLRNKLKTLKT